MHGRVGTFLKRLYYFSGLAYYLYHWFFLLGGAGLAGGIIAALLHSPYLAYSLVPVSLCVLGLGVIVWSTRATMQFQSHNPQIEEVLVENTYTIKGNHYRYSKRLIIRSLSAGVDSYLTKFIWSGGQDVRPSADHPEQRIRIYPEPNGVHTVCRFEFERQLNKNEQYEFSYHFDMVDQAGVARPFLSHAVRCPTQKLVLRVRAEDRRIPFYRRLVFASQTSDIPLFEETVVSPPNSTEFVFEVAMPRMGYRYSLQW